MMKKLLLLLGVALFAVACGKEPADPGTGPTPTPPPEVFWFEKADFNVKSGGETILVKITTDTTFDFEIDEDDQDWVALSTAYTSTDSRKYFRIEQNTSYDERAATITFTTAGNQKHYVTITQEPVFDVLVNAQREYPFDANGGVLGFSVDANMDYEVTFQPVAASEWIVRRTEPETRALEHKDLAFDVLANNTTADRKATLSIVQKGGANKKVDILVTQTMSDMVFTDAKAPYEMGVEGGRITFWVSYNVPYTVTVEPAAAASWLVQPTATRALSRRQLVFDVHINTDAERAAKIVITPEAGHGLTPLEIPVTQEMGDYLSSDAKASNIFNPEGGKLEFTVTTNSPGFDVDVSGAWFPSDYTFVDNVTPAGLHARTITYTIPENTSNNSRQATITLDKGDAAPVVIAVEQYGTIYDGMVTTLQTAPGGRGADVVFMGDGFTRTEIENGTYMKIMEQCVGYFFDAEPYKSFRGLFNIHVVTVISDNANFGDGGESSSQTKLKGWYEHSGTATSVGGNRQLAIDYSRKAVLTDARLDETLAVIILNTRAKRSGTCYYSWPGDFGSSFKNNGPGFARAYMSRSTSNADLRYLILHECGHGFAKLADEYVYGGNDGNGAPYSGTIPAVTKTAMIAEYTDWGWSPNVDFSSSMSQVRWSKFANADSRYTQSWSTVGLGSLSCYQGARYQYGIWRPTSNSIMRDNVYSIFNVPCREAIYIRIHSLADPNWVYNFSEFLEWDAVNYGQSSRSAAGQATPMVVEQPQQPLAPPVYPDTPRPSGKGNRIVEKLQ
jgi:hypothetical protein